MNILEDKKPVELKLEKRLRLAAQQMEQNIYSELVADGVSPHRALRQAKAEAQAFYFERPKTAKELATEAGLTEEKSPKIRRLVEWFRASAEPLIDQLCPVWNEADRAQDLADQENYYESRSARYRFNLLVEYTRRRQNDHGIGIYWWKYEGKTFRSWLGNEPLATPRQIAGKLSAKYPNHDIDIIVDDWTNTNCEGASIVGGISVPKYRAYITPKLPNVLLTAERLYLDYGKVLDMEAAKVIQKDFEAGNITREIYVDEIAKLCREAPLDEDFNDYRCGIWVQVNQRGQIEEFEIDDTRDMLEDKLDFEFFYTEFKESGFAPDGTPVVLTNRQRHRNLQYEWEESERQSDMDTGNDVQALLGISTQQIDDTYEIVGQEATLREFFENLQPRQRGKVDTEALFYSGNDVMQF